jgi:hypothetical protein
LTFMSRREDQAIYIANPLDPGLSWHILIGWLTTPKLVMAGRYDAPAHHFFVELDPEEVDSRESNLIPTIILDGDVISWGDTRCSRAGTLLVVLA